MSAPMPQLHMDEVFVPVTTGNKHAATMVARRVYFVVTVAEREVARYDRKSQAQAFIDGWEKHRQSIHTVVEAL